MGHSDKSAFAELPKFLPKDKPSWGGDWNQAMDKIDVMLSTQQRTINDLSAQVAALQAKVGN